MPRMTLFDTTLIRSTELPGQVPSMFKFIADNRSMLIDLDRQTEIYKNKNQLASTSINLLFSHIIDSDTITYFAPIDLTGMNIKIPNAYTNPSIVIDTEQYPTQVGTIRAFPEFHRKAVINLTTLLKADKNTRDTRVSDVNSLHKQFTRAFFVMSYYDNYKYGWLTPNMCKYIIQTYSLALSSKIKRIYNLNMTEQNQIASFLSLYMAQQLSNESEDLGQPSLMQLCTYLGSRNEISDFMKTYEQVTKQGLSFIDTIGLAIENGPSRMKDFSVGAMFRTAPGLCQDYQCGMIAYEYAPYWVDQLFAALSGTKVGLYFSLKDHNLLNDGIKFARNLVTNKNIVESIKRR